MNTTADLKKQLKDQNVQTFRAPQRRIDFQQDTLDNKRVDDGFAAAYYRSWRNTVTVNIREGEDNSFNKTKATKAHEQKHRDNQLAGMYDLSVGLEQNYKLHCIDEISANICELLQWREEYIQAKTDKQREAIMESLSDSKFSYYATAIKSGKVNPLSTNPEDFEKEMKFIGQATQNMWMNLWARPYDNQAHVSMVRLYFREHDYEDMKPNEGNYQKARKIALGNIGGIDFTEYLDDIECINPNMAKADKMLAEDKPRDEIEGALKECDYIMDALVDFEQFSQLKAWEYTQMNIRELENVRKLWFEAKDKKMIPCNEFSIAEKWLKAAQSGKFEIKEPMGEEEKAFIGQLINTDSFKLCSSDMDKLKDYYVNAGAENLKNAVQSGQTNLNFARKKSEMFTICGVDFSGYVENPVQIEPHIVDLNERVVNGEILDENNDFKEFDKTKEILKPKLNLNSKLSPEQQFRIAQHQMFMENALARDPTSKSLTADDLKRLSNPDKVAQYLIDDFKKQLDENPTLKAEWAKKEQELAEEIARQNQSIVFLSKGDDKVYAEELKKVYTVNGIDMRDLYGKNLNVESLVKRSDVPESIVAVQNDSLWGRFKNKMRGVKNSVKSKTKSVWGKIKGVFTKKEENNDVVEENNQPVESNKDYRKRQYEPDITPEKPEYDTKWSPTNRVSKVMYEDIYDFTKPFLKERLETLVRNSQQILSVQAQENVNEHRFNKKADEMTIKGSSKNKQTERKGENQVTRGSSLSGVER